MHMCLLIFFICIEILLCKYETKDSDVLSKCYLCKNIKRPAMKNAVVRVVNFHSASFHHKNSIKYTH